MDTKNTPPPSNPNPNPTASTNTTDTASPSKPMLAFHFLRALSSIHGSTPARRRTRTIRRAAYSSMARASNPRRAWSMALLRQMRARRAPRSRRAVLLRRRAGAGAVDAAAASHAGAPPAPRQPGEPPRAEALRQLVPGGRSMEYSSLLEETADYVRCLRAQVQLMQGLVDLFSCQ